MAITSDLSLDASRFHPDNIDEATKKINTFITEITTNGPKWYNVGVVRYREMRETGETPLPVPVYLPGAIDAAIPSREQGRMIPIRVYKPDNGQPSKGIYLYFHGGGFVLGTHKHNDGLLQAHANKFQLTAISVGYRLAPEHPYPAATDDSIDAAEYLVDHGPQEYGCPLRFISGSSAGGTLAAVSVLQLMRSRPSHQLSGVVFVFGYFDLTLGLPKASTFTKPLIINHAELERFNGAYLPDMSSAERRHPGVSPLYEDLQALAADSPKGLPPALFICGTEDPLLDDTVLMGSKWAIAGAESVVKIYPGAAHGFVVVPGLPVADEANAVMFQFVQEKLDSGL
ncbi:hypothetical protein FE257_007545 [Aspergillus nanangensis]|uniref:Alpha/beta hydrolase fold-3 domain-containing protein n=1 Tax=Aspergillus nanangensis TaxID=2582783 RepID=A0AAD4CPC1_ASPNN|nr:hypothetical protein FE257_007545 [Aspergillus nanangensis]